MTVLPRAATLVAIAGWHAARYALAGRRRTPVGAAMATAFEDLGPAFVKIGQLLAARPDILPSSVYQDLARLNDRARPMDAAIARRLWACSDVADPATRDGLLRSFPDRAVASGSIASVYRVQAGREDLAVKVRRQGVATLMTGDLRVFTRLASLLARLPRLRGLPVRPAVRTLTGCLLAQLDLGAELRNLRDFRVALTTVPGVLVPAPRAELSSGSVLVAEWVTGLATDAVSDESGGGRRLAVERALRAVFKALFMDGLVHCDLHAGNLYPREDGTVVVLDMGLCYRLTDRTRVAFAQFFADLVNGDGQACAKTVLRAAVEQPSGDTTAFVAAVSDLVTKSSGADAREFDLRGFATDLFAAQRRHGMIVDAEFVFPLLSLLVLEGIVQRWHPHADFQLEAAPYVMAALAQHVTSRP